MNCNEVKNLIQLYMDNELDARYTLNAQQHLETCAACSRLLDAYLKQDQTLRQSASLERIDSSLLREKILASIQDQSAASAGRWLIFPIGRRVAAVATMLVIAALLLVRGALLPGINESVYAAAASDHANHCSIENVMGAIIDRHELDRLSGVYAALESTPDLSAFGYENPRGTICKINGTDFLHLVFHNPEKQAISIFARRHSSDVKDNQLMLLQQDGYQVASISRSGVDLLVVSPLDEKQTSAIAEKIAAEL